MNQRIVKGLGILLTLTAITAFTAYANSSRDTDGPGGRQGPPPEAIQACSNKQEGESVSFKGGRGETLTATCQYIDNQLVAVPEGHGRMQGQSQRPQRPPQEAFDACAAKSAGESITFTGRRGESITATCQLLDGQLVAVPDRKERHQ